MELRNKNGLNLFSSEKNFLRVTYFMAFSFTFSPFLTSLTLIAFSIISLFNFHKVSNSSENQKDFLMLSALFFIYVIGLIYTPYFDRALKLTVRISPIFIIPTLAYITKLNQKVNYSSLKKYFIFGIILSCTSSLIVGLIKCIFHNSFDYLFYYKLGEFLHIHPVYYALFILTAIHFVTTTNNRTLLKYRIWINTLLYLFIILLQSKVALFALIVYILFLFFNPNIGRSNKKEFYLPLIFLIIIGLTSLTFENNRFKELFVKRSKIEIGNFKEDGTSQRLWLWNEAFIQLVESPLLGFGLGSQNKLFTWKVEKKLLNNSNSPAFSKAARNISKLNLHNQFIQTFYEFGITGGGLFVISIIYIYILAVRKKKLNFLVVYSFFILFMLTENLLDRQMGIYFCSFILSLLFLDPDPASFYGKHKRHQVNKLD